MHDVLLYNTVYNQLHTAPEVKLNLFRIVGIAAIY